MKENSMTLTKLHTIANYEEELANFIEANEGNRVYVHTDGVGIPTIGSGYALIEKNQNHNWRSDFTKAKISFSRAQGEALDSLLNSANQILASSSSIEAKENEVRKLVKAYNKTPNAMNISGHIGDLFMAVKSVYEKRVESRIGAKAYKALANTKELVALVDLAYNVGIGDKLAYAIQNNNRAEAWFEIRYNTNGGASYRTVGAGIAKRRISQSDQFGLYPMDADEDDYKQVMRMYTAHKDKIYSVEHDSYKPSLNNETIGSVYSGRTIDLEISKAKEYLAASSAKTR